MPELHETMMGRSLIQHTLPDIGDQLKRIADAMEKSASPKDVMEVGIYHYTDDAGNKVYDIEKMQREFDLKISKLKNR